jgi:hypothetical protein
MAVLRRRPLPLLVDAVEGIPFPDSPRERLTRSGPLALELIIGIELDDVDDTARRCHAPGAVRSPLPLSPHLAERSVEVQQPYGYSCKLFHLLPDVGGDGLGAVADTCFGNDVPAP